MSRLVILALILGAFAASGCEEERSSSLRSLLGKEILVKAEPTVITTGTSSQVRANEWSGKLVSADKDWIVLSNGDVIEAVSRDRVVSIYSNLAQQP